MSGRSFADDREAARAAGRRGGYVRAAQLRAQREGPAPYVGNFQEFLTDAGLTGPSWIAWRTLWKVADARPLDETELNLFREYTGRTTPPRAPVREVWDIIGRRGGKTRIKAARALWTGIRRNWLKVLAPGERPVIPLIAADKRQARQALSYIKGLLTLPAFAPYQRRKLKDSVELVTGITIEVATASFKTTRGFTCPLVLGDEIAFWATDDGSASPDVEVLQALRPTMSTIADALLAAGSTPYARRGELFKAYEKYWGQDDADVLVWVAPSLVMNPTLDPRVVARAFEDDAVAASAEFGAEWRRDVTALFDPEALRPVVVPGRRELPPLAGVSYVAFVDPSGGSQDSFALAIAHAEGERAVLDCVREVRPPFSPEAVVVEFAELLNSYRITDVTGDRYGGEWPREQFRKHGITYTPSEKPKSDLYRELLPVANSGRVELLDHPRLFAQLVNLERHVSRSGKDNIDHAPGGRDDVANAVAGALVAAAGEGDGSALVWSAGRIINLLTGETVRRAEEDWP